MIFILMKREFIKDQDRMVYGSWQRKITEDFALIFWLLMVCNGWDPLFFFSFLSESNRMDSKRWDWNNYSILINEHKMYRIQD